MTPLSGFVQRLGPQLLHNGDPFPIVGTNTYYLAYVEESTLIGALDLAVSFGMNVLRTWAFLDTEKAPGPGEVSFQYWDAATKAPRLQDGENGLVRLDRAIAQAGERGIRLILTLTNNWPDFGGMPRYVEWFGMAGKKNHFYTDQRCRTAYQNYVRELVTRRNTITGRLYSDEPAILAWELANESRCEDFLDGTEKLLGWVDEMSRYIRGLDSNHLIAVGDEGYLGMYGVNSEKLLEIEHIDESSGVVVCVKPEHAEAVMRLAGARGATRLLSVVAGLSTARIEATLPSPIAVIRAMTNTPVLVRKGVSAIAGGAHVSKDDLDWAESILGAVGTVVRVTERNIDAVSGLSGPMPAYLYLVVEALIEAGVHQGLSRDVAHQLVVGTFEGSAALLTSTGATPEELRHQVTSPGGTTAAGLRTLEHRAVRSAFIDAVTAAADRSRQMGR